MQRKSTHRNKSCFCSAADVSQEMVSTRRKQGYTWSKVVPESRDKKISKNVSGSMKIMGQSQPPMTFCDLDVGNASMPYMLQHFWGKVLARCIICVGWVWNINEEEWHWYIFWSRDRMHRKGSQGETEEKILCNSVPCKIPCHELIPQSAVPELDTPLNFV